MTGPPRRHRHRVRPGRGRRAFVAALVAVLLALVGIPSGVGHADGGYNPPPPPGFTLPGFDVNEVVPDTELGGYPYQPVDPQIVSITADSPLLDPDELRSLGNDPKKFDAGSLDHMRIRWRIYLDDKKRNGQQPRSFDSWRRAYATILENRRIGDAFENYVEVRAQLGPEWSKGKVASLPDSEVFDLQNISEDIPVAMRAALEMKAGNSLSTRDRRQLEQHLRTLSEAGGASMIYVFGAKPTPATERAMQRIFDTVADQLRAAGQPVPGLFPRYLPAKATTSAPPGTSAPPVPDLPTDLTPDSAAEAADDEALEEQINNDIDTRAPPQAQPGQAPPAAPYEPQASQVPVPQRQTVPAPQQQVPVGVPAPPVSVPAPPVVVPAPPVVVPAPPVVVPAPPVVVPAPPVVVPAPPVVIPAPAVPAPPVAVPAPPVTVPAPPLSVPAPPLSVPAPGASVPAPPVSAPAPPVSVPAPPVGVPVGAPSAAPVPGIGLGGIDFSNLELRYMTTSVSGQPGMQFAFRVGTAPDDTVSYGGRRNAEMAMNAFFVWLALPPENFWVNLKPTEPDRIIEADFGRTDAGRVLLEADLAMKIVSGQLQNTDTGLGRAFVDALQGNKCFLGRRQWIEPLPATVHVDGDQLFIIDAPLTVKLGMEPSDVSPGASCPGQDPATTARNGEIYQQMIMPAVAEAVNHDPRFADLRRVYTSRVAAQWYRERNAVAPTQFADIINSGDISRWVYPWSPREVFDRYVTSFNNPAPTFTWTDTANNTVWTHSWGGVDFSKVETHEVGNEEFATTYAPAAKSATASVVGAVRDPSGNQLWLGAIGTSVPLDQLRAAPARTWVPYVLSEPATSGPVFYLLGLPVLLWLTAGVVLIWRRGEFPSRRRVVT